MTVKKVVRGFWRYLIVVVVSCACALLVSRQGRAEQGGASNAPISGDSARPTATDFIWYDEARKREVPVRIVSSALPTAANAAPGKFPVLLFSHGLGGALGGGKLWTDHWAAHGYIVVQLQHRGSDENLWKAKPPDQKAAALKAGATMGNLALRVGDVQFVIDQIVQKARAGEGVLAFADVGKIGMAGHSFGAHTTMAVAGQSHPSIGGQGGLDLRVKAAIALSPNARNKTQLERQFGDIRIPLMSITGTADGEVLDDGSVWEQRTLPYANMPAGGKYLLVFDAGDHMIFGGHPAMRQRGGGARDATRDAQIQQDVMAATLAFWNATLKQDRVAKQWLEDGRFKATLTDKDRYEFK